jgi:hypothetical protein
LARWTSWMSSVKSWYFLVPRHTVT